MSDSLKENSTFNKEIESKSSICSNCYRRVKSYSKPHHTMPDVATPLVEYEQHVETGWFDDRHDSGKECVKRSYCKCGNVDDAKIRPFEDSELMVIASRIVERLKEEGFEIDENHFFDIIKTYKGDPDIHFNEEKYFEEAIEVSIIKNEA